MNSERDELRATLLAFPPNPAVYAKGLQLTPRAARTFAPGHSFVEHGFTNVSARADVDYPGNTLLVIVSAHARALADQASDPDDFPAVILDRSLFHTIALVDDGDGRWIVVVTDCGSDHDGTTPVVPDIHQVTNDLRAAATFVERWRARSGTASLNRPHSFGYPIGPRPNGTDRPSAPSN